MCLCLFLFIFQHEIFQVGTYIITKWFFGKTLINLVIHFGKLRSSVKVKIQDSPKTKWHTT